MEVSGVTLLSNGRNNRTNKKGGVLVDRLQAKRMMKRMRKCGSVLLAFLLSLMLLPVPAYGGTPAQPQKPALEVLEVQPGTSYDLSALTTSDWSSCIPDRTVHVTQMSMPEFISKVDEINGKYDIVYIGNNTKNNVSYTYLGKVSSRLPEGGNSSKEYYSDNDITNRRAAVLKEFIESKQLTVFDQSIFNIRTVPNLKLTKLYQDLNSYVNNTQYANVVLVDTSNNYAKKSNLKSAFAGYTSSSAIAKRPELTITTKPQEYDGTDRSYQTGSNKSLGYNFDMQSSGTANDLTVKLYLDINGDGIFKATNDSQSEQVFTLDHRPGGSGYAINYHLPDLLIGLLPWKLEVTDNATGAKTYVTGATALKAAKGNELKIRVLQLKPDGNTFSVYDDLKNVYDNSTRSYQNLLFKDGVYDIQVTEMDVNDFNAAYANLQSNQLPQSKPARVNGQNKTAPTQLNKYYDMVIVGFADIYGGNDLNSNALQALQNFIQTNQSVMFTHDTQTFDVQNKGSWAYNLTQNFRSLVGQQRYYRTAPDSGRYYDRMPDASKDSYGFSNLTLDRANSNTFQTTTQTHKINDNLVTQFPYILGDIQVAPTHFQYFQLDLEDENVVPVYTLNNSSGSTIYTHPGDGRNDYYTYTKGTITYSGTGHSKPNAVEEMKMFVNTIFKASRGANHAPTVEVYGISNGMNISNASDHIDFSFKATDIDLTDQYLNADIYLATSQDGTNFSDYQPLKSFRTTDDPSARLTSGVTKSVRLDKAPDTGIKAYKVKVLVFDNYNAQVSQEISLNNVFEPQIAVEGYNDSCLVGDKLNIPLNVQANATNINESFHSIKLQSTVKAPDGTSNINSYDVPDVSFNPASSWSGNQQSYPYSWTFDQEGTYRIVNQLTYNVLNDPINSPPTRENDQTFTIHVKSGEIKVVVLDTQDRAIPNAKVTSSSGSSQMTSNTGAATFAGLKTGNYTVNLEVPEGRSLVGNTTQTVGLDKNQSYQEITYRLDGSIIQNPSLTSRSGNSEMSEIRNEALQTNIGFTLARPAADITLDLANSLPGSTMNVNLTKVLCNGTPIEFNVDQNNPGKIYPKDTSFHSGTYTVYATLTLSGTDLQEGQSFTVTLTHLTSAKDAVNGGIDSITTEPSLKVNVVSSQRLH
ncbi:DUF5057 domain-containing protein [Desulfitobacterium sp.]|uniref:DUF5057 domain-containing protein n=1 Tax=Desulfitobacterium sp. TaxID=49981 RepID=UPI002B21B9F1|nr:DUF5057 domain-containing protein [Desulfitobacterium sp.]MEA4901298.1 DUF5057 domain-containing protein [Desulfitobacterium sp.]